MDRGGEPHAGLEVKAPVRASVGCAPISANSRRIGARVPRSDPKTHFDCRGANRVLFKPRFDPCSGIPPARPRVEIGPFRLQQVAFLQAPLFA